MVYCPMPLSTEAETIVAESVVLVKVCDEPAVTPVVEAPFTPARVLLLGLIARLVTAIVVGIGATGKIG